MLKSMTGFGRAEAASKKQRITVEVKSVNHRYLDLSIKMPRKLNFLEGEIRSLIKSYVTRGKMDLFITYEDYANLGSSLKYNAALAEQYLTYIRQMSRDFGLEDDIRVTMLSRFPDVFTMEDTALGEDEAWAALKPVLGQALEQFVQSRVREGEHLKADISGKLDLMEEKVKAVQERSPQVLEAYRRKLEQKMQELLADTSIEDQRIAAEVVLFADKICNDEETVRLMSHIEGMRKALDGADGVGRSLDFIAQEMNREANTILSKSSDIEVTNLAIELKTEIEKVREQVQNVE